MKHAKNIRMDRKTWNRENVMSAIYRLFWIYVICGVAGFVIETVWCWIDFQEFTSRTSNLFFPINCVWGVGGVVLYLTTLKNHWNNGIYIFAKCTLVGTVFEFLCGYLGEHLLEVTFWDYSGMPLHIGKYINLPFCMVWGLIGVLWVRKVYPLLKQKLEKPVRGSGRLAVNLFLMFMIVSQLFTGTALLRMHARQEGKAAESRMAQVLDTCFTDQMLQAYFQKMKSTVTGEKIYIPKGN